MAQNPDWTAIVDFVRQRARGVEYREFMVRLLCDLIEIENTTTARPLPDIVEHEQKAFDRLEATLRQFTGPEVTFERQSINPDIEDHPYYTRVYYTADEDHPQGLPVEDAYRGRFNLLARVEPKVRSEQGKPVLLNAHVDTVSPYVPLRKDEVMVYGRGACDDKGAVVTLAAHMKLMSEIEKQFGPLPSQPAVYQFVIEEEPGGNGSLSAALDKRFRGYEAVICEATKGVPFPANRGAMWFQLDLDTSGTTAGAAEVMPFILAELAKEGQQLRAETNQPLFPKEYVQVNTGTLGSFGRHPSAVNDYIPYEMTIEYDDVPKDKLTAQIHDMIRSSLAFYHQAYADRTRETDPATGQPKLAADYQLTELGQVGRAVQYKLEIFGIGGHMGAMLLCDNALLKTGYVLQALVRAFHTQPGIRGEFRLAGEQGEPQKLTLTGGVGFTPSHKMAQLRSRLVEAAHRGIRRYNETVRGSVPATGVHMSFDKLHNEAYASPVDCPAMKAFHAAYQALNLSWPRPIAFRASCDARIYGNGGYNTITFGPGDLADAHADHEKITVEELQKSLEILALTTLSLTGQF